MRPDVVARFRAVVARAVARADRELAAHLAGIRPYRKQTRRKYAVAMQRPRRAQADHDMQ
jgi:hypothetical protein